MVLNFHIQSDSPASPTRRWAMNGDLRDNSETIPAEAAITGLATTKNKAPATRSIASTNVGTREELIVASITSCDKGTPSTSSIVTGAHCEEGVYRIFAAFLHLRVFMAF
jgi:hypothetical protein